MEVIIDKLPPEIKCRCVNCEAIYSRYGILDTTVEYICHCGYRQTPTRDWREPMTAREIDERYQKIGGEMQEAMGRVLEPLIKQLLHIMEKNK